MSRIADQRAERLQALQDSSIREGEIAAQYEAMADTLELVKAKHPAWGEEIARLRKTAEHHRGWGDKWRRDREALVAQYERTEPSPIGRRPTAGDLRRYREEHASWPQR